MKMKGGISVLVGAILVVFSLTMVAEAQRKNRIRGNQGRKSVGKPGNTIQQNRKGQSSMRESWLHLQRKRQGQPSIILDDTTSPTVQKKRTNGEVKLPMQGLAERDRR